MPVNENTNRQMEPLPTVFGGEKQTPHAVFEKSRADNQGQVANHRPNDLAMGCPSCKQQGTGTVRLFAKEGVGYYCVNGHNWKDIDQLMALNPEKLAFQGHKARQEGYRELRLEMPGSTLESLQAKFGERLAETVAAFMDALAQPRMLLVHEEDLERIEQNLGVQLRNGRDLVGITFERSTRLRELTEQTDKLQNRAQQVQRATGSTPTTVPVDLEDLFDHISQLAGDRGEPVEQLVLNALRQAKEYSYL